MYKAGLDIGSTTAKLAVLDARGDLVFNAYQRHHTKIFQTAAGFFDALLHRCGDIRLNLSLTGSASLGTAKVIGRPFVQEVIAAARVVKTRYPEVSAALDIGGEDSKMVFFNGTGPPDIRMNGSCAGGTGSFIDQMAALMNITPTDLDRLARGASRIHPVASRCGVFAKTDVQNMFSRNVPHADIAASVFHAVALQCINSLARGKKITPKLLICGGVLTFLPRLVTQFCQLLRFSQKDLVIPRSPELIPALGAAMADPDPSGPIRVREMIRRLKRARGEATTPRMAPLFTSPDHFDTWRQKSRGKPINTCPLSAYRGRECYIGVDSGSTTTKIVVAGENREILFSWYKNNDGDPIGTVIRGLKEFKTLLGKNKGPAIAKTAVTGYGEDLIRTALGLDLGLVETMAHFTAAKSLEPRVSFLLDIGGQDIKAVFVKNGLIHRVEVNEACSSGCGSFLETLAASLNQSISQFSLKACHARAPCDLGTRCTVFMNSKIKQSLRENASLEDISAGLSYSVIKNCLFKVLKLYAMDELGDHPVLQGGAFRNPSLVRAMEILTGKAVTHTRTPELMGAFGAALFARQIRQTEPGTVFPGLDDLDGLNRYPTRQLTCKGCENQCAVTRFRFKTGDFYSGNKCEKMFSARGKNHAKGFDFLRFKTALLFDRPQGSPETAGPVLGIPRCLNFYENYPFWHELFTQSGLRLVLSPPSTMKMSEKSMGTVMSDNICFPAKLVHAHIQALAEKKADRIFYPLVVYENNPFPSALNAYNCPIVSSYPDVIQSAVDPLARWSIPLDRPVFNFNDPGLLKKACFSYLASLGIPRARMARAFDAAVSAQNAFRQTILETGRQIIQKAEQKGSVLVVLGGRPYHADSLINHKIGDILTELGADIITEDAVPAGEKSLEKVRVVTQWVFPNRIYNAAEWVAGMGPRIQMVQINSFGCGPDAVVNDEVSQILKTRGKHQTIIKVDEISSPGSVRLRLRSMIESLKRSREKAGKKRLRKPFVRFTEKDRDRTIWAPFFSEDYAAYLPWIFKNAGYRFRILPPPDRKSVDLGLQFASNDICYPGTIIIGDIIKALQHDRFDPKRIAVGITQTGGQCRASNYLALIRKAMIRAGYADIPLISVTASQGLVDQPGFAINWLKKARLLLVSTMYADAIAKMYYATAPREKTPGRSHKIRTHYMARAQGPITRGDCGRLFSLLGAAVDDFNTMGLDKGDLPRMGVVGEIYAKYNYFANQDLVHWLIRRKIEPVLPPIVDYFLQDLVNFKENIRAGIRQPKATDLLSYPLSGLIRFYHGRINRLFSGFKHGLPFDDIHEVAERAGQILTMTNQFGEGWLVPGEIAMFARAGIRHVVSLQPFGCIANHIISKGVETRIKALYPEINIHHLDFDAGISEVNVRNRLHFMVEHIN